METVYQIIDKIELPNVGLLYLCKFQAGVSAPRVGDCLKDEAGNRFKVKQAEIVFYRRKLTEEELLSPPTALKLQNLDDSPVVGQTLSTYTE